MPLPPGRSFPFLGWLWKITSDPHYCSVPVPFPPQHPESIHRKAEAAVNFGHEDPLFSPCIPGCRCSVIYLCEPQSPSKLLGLFLHCLTFFLQICSHTSYAPRNTFFSITAPHPALHTSPWPSNSQGDK